MQFRDLSRQYQALQLAIDEAMQRVASGSHYIMGPEVKALEEELADYVGSRYCLTCANGTDALTLALKAWGIGQGDAVFVPDFTFFSTAEVVALEGAHPIFVDVSPTTFNIDPSSLEQAIQAVLADGRLTPKVIISVDLFGLPAPYEALRTLANQYHLYLLEDGAQGFGGAIDGKRACSFGDISTTSFFPAKPLGCYGDGGAIFTDNPDWAALISSYRVHGKGTDKYDNVRIGLNSRLDTLQAAILQVKLQAFRDKELKQVNRAATIYNRLLRGRVIIPTLPDGYCSSWAQYTIRLQDSTQRTHVQSVLKQADIPSMVYYPKPMHAQSAFQGLWQPMDVNAFASNRLCDTVLSLPMSPYITPEEIAQVCTRLLSAL